MNVDERIARLEALLARVRSRSKALPPTAAPPEVLQNATIATADAPHDAPQDSSRDAWPGGASDAAVERASDARTRTPRAEARPTAPPLYAPEPPPLEVIELDIEPEPSVPPPAPTPPAGSIPSAPPIPPPPENGDELLESRSRLVSAPPVTDLARAEDEASPLEELAASEPSLEVAAVAELSAAEAEALDREALDRDAEEEPPSSSRRPIDVEEKLMQLAEDAPPLHTPPPESGKLPAAPLVLDELDAEDTGVRRADATVFGAEATAFDAGDAYEDDAAEIVGAAASPRPLTFGDLLDLTLRL